EGMTTKKTNRDAGPTSGAHGPTGRSTRDAAAAYHRWNTQPQEARRNLRDPGRPWFRGRRLDRIPERSGSSREWDDIRGQREKEGNRVRQSIEPMGPGR